MTLVEIVRGALPYQDSHGNLPKNPILLQNLITNLETEETVDESFPNGVFSNESRDFVKTCLKKQENRPKFTRSRTLGPIEIEFPGLNEMEFYRQYSARGEEGRKELV